MAGAPYGTPPTRDSSPEPPGAGARLLLILFVVLAVVVVGGGLLGLRLLTAGPSGPPHPDSWDPRVQRYVDAVEHERGLDFKQPVYVDFLSDAAFSKKVTSDEEDLTAEDRKEIEQSTGVFRALGLLHGDVDLFDSMNELNGTGIIGYYSFEDERIRVRGTKITLAVQSTLVHELTHALQDQYFDIGTRVDLLEDDDTAASAYRALVEGDARRVEADWRESLDKANRKTLDKSLADQVDEFERSSQDIPEVLTTLMASPYEFGQAMLKLAVRQGGEGAVDALFRVPPTTEEHQLDPWTLVPDRQVALPAREPRLTPGDDSFDHGDFGAIGWLIVLGERLPADQALTAADGWGGDSYVAFERDENTCVRVNYVGDTPQDLREMQTALTTWVGKAPAGSANVRREGSVLKFESCDPGPQGDGATGPADGGAAGAVRLAVTRTYLSAQLLGLGLDEGVARCGADRMVRAFSAAELNAPKLDPGRVQRVLAPCREA